MRAVMVLAILVVLISGCVGGSPVNHETSHGARARAAPRAPPAGPPAVEASPIAYEGTTDVNLCFGLAGVQRCAVVKPGTNTMHDIAVPTGAIHLRGTVTVTTGPWIYTHVRLLRGTQMLAYKDAVTPLQFNFTLPADVESATLYVGVADGPVPAGSYVWPSLAQSFTVDAELASR